MTHILELPLRTFDNPDVKHLWLNEQGQGLALVTRPNVTLEDLRVRGCTADEFIMALWELPYTLCNKEMDTLIVTAQVMCDNGQADEALL